MKFEGHSYCLNYSSFDYSCSYSTAIPETDADHNHLGYASPMVPSQMLAAAVEDHTGSLNVVLAMSRSYVLGIGGAKGMDQLMVSVAVG